MRAETRRVRRERAAFEARPQGADHDDSGLREQLAWLRAELATLNDQPAQLLAMRYKLGWTLQRIGEALGLKPGAVDGRLNRAVAALRRKAEERFHD